jgi:hypothetical protein
MRTKEGNKLHKANLKRFHEAYLKAHKEYIKEHTCIRCGENIELKQEDNRVLCEFHKPL